MTDRLHDHLRWARHALPADAAAGAVPLHVGEVAAAGGVEAPGGAAAARDAEAGRPRAVLVAGQHGDEGPWGALAIAGVLRRGLGSLRGSLRVVLCANPLAAAADARNAPLDHLDVNTLFPGQASGSHSQRLAALLATQVEDADVVIDLHGGGSWCVNAFTYRFAGDEDLAALVGAPFAVDIPPPPGGLIEHARAHGARVLAIEMGGRGRDEIAWCARITDAMVRVLQATGVLAPEPEPPAVPRPVTVRDTRVLRPVAGGLFVPTLGEGAIGEVVPAGTELGRLLDAHTLRPLETFSAPYDATALLLLRPHVGRIEGGAMTYVVGRPVG